MTDLKDLVGAYVDIYRLGYEAGYDDCKKKMELEALKRVSKGDIERIVRNSTKGGIESAESL